MDFFMRKKASRKIEKDDCSQYLKNMKHILDEMDVPLPYSQRKKLNNDFKDNREKFRDCVTDELVKNQK